MDNAQSPELRTYLAGQISRAAAIFNVDEVVVFDEECLPPKEGERKQCIAQLVKILEYLECPQYLRKDLFPMQKDLQFAGLLNPLDCRHHFRAHDLSIRFREGVATKRPVKEGSSTRGSHINVGLEKDVLIDVALKPGTRVTVELDENSLKTEDGKKPKKLRGKAVPPSEPRTSEGLYWGYCVRVAHSLSDVLTKSSFRQAYDLMVGTSERGDDVDQVLDMIPTDFKHCIIVFGGLKGLEAALESDTKLSQVDDPRDLFQYYLNTCPGQGSNTIRTEEALLITLSSIRHRLLKARENQLK
jgi:predicted SPOUT superfamily RNA methylase MTH1